MATYEYICLACEHPFEERRPMSSGPVDIALACPSCGSDRVRRRFSFSAATGKASSASERPVAGGCCGGSCGCSN
ncbi:MAG: zinc ribbon domain-containing protein [Actinobacteria bacterium]|nr:MAG: zinc ribbon domain-containing protein [Actinomycetota bacterium]